MFGTNMLMNLISIVNTLRSWMRRPIISGGCHPPANRFRPSRAGGYSPTEEMDRLLAAPGSIYHTSRTSCYASMDGM